MAITHKKVRSLLRRKNDTSVDEASLATEEALRIIEGRWKLRILFHLNAEGVMRFSALERAIPTVSHKVLVQQLRELERDGALERREYPEVPRRVEYTLTQWGRDLCPALLALRQWAALRNMPIIAGLENLEEASRAETE